ncbi:type II restriction endonuclease subunit M [Streptomyces inusitatus]|uniref:Type II restriction endonuclease subunit M n=1 Tax=Streptomyces inusitatus TaxID=68221 RepID=A0A918PV66_9ACTN|nr:N-6 DNA methylase [Streptomyces inusitatus]GGZ24045.1 type II restriction endonuclease subunit M [Streptomyces inusitatus]
MPENASEVTAAGIARLAGVGRAAVSNWRRRHPDFPKPVGGTETSPSFPLTKVEQWLRDQGKLAEVPLRERVWQQLADHPATTATALIRTGCVLLLVRERPALWQELAAAPDEETAQLLPTALEAVLAARFGDDRAQLFRAAFPRSTPGSAAKAPGSTAVLRSAAELAAELGPCQTFEFLLGRFLDANLRQYTLTPPGPAALMAALAAPHEGATVLDPAAGAGALLGAVDRPAALYAQDTDPDLTALTALRLALRSDAAVRARSGDTLRADAFPGTAADAVLCHPPFNERNWGHDELAYDPRWEYGFPARTESELAWVQHAIARLRPGGTAVLLMPPAAASRRSGRRVRAGLLRRGALRAVIALPVGAAPPYGIPLHLWVLRKPEQGQAQAPELLLVETAELAAAAGGRDRLDWPALQQTVLDAWRAFDTGGTPTGDPNTRPGDRPGTRTGHGPALAVPVLELLDDDVDLAPARHVPSPDSAVGADELLRVRERLTDTIRLAGELAPPPPAPAQPAPWPATTVGELARTGALLIRAGTVHPAAGGHSGPGAVLTEQDVLTGMAPSGALAEETDDELVRVESGDAVVPVLGGGSVVRVIDEATAGAVLGRNLHLLRPDPAALDVWFLAGFLRGTANTRQASSYASSATRLDVRRLQLPRLSPSEQRRYGEHFRALAAFEDALRLAGRLGEQLVQGLYDGLADGTVRPG